MLAISDDVVGRHAVSGNGARVPSHPSLHDTRRTPVVPIADHYAPRNPDGGLVETQPMMSLIRMLAA
jgi:hypothetical protein